MGAPGDSLQRRLALALPTFYYAHSVSATTDLIVPGLAAGTYDVRAWVLSLSGFEVRVAGGTTPAAGVLTLEPALGKWARRMEGHGASVMPRSLRNVAVGATRVLNVSDATAVEGESLSFTVTLNTAPDTGQTVQVTYQTWQASGLGAVAQTGDYTSRVGITLTFAAGETTKTVTVQTTEDTVSEVDEHIRLLDLQPGERDHREAVAGDGTIIDDDRTAAVRVDPTELELWENPALSGVDAGDAVTNTGEYEVVLASPPTGDVTVTVSGEQASDFTVSPTTLTFTTTNWYVAQEVTVTAVDDTDREAFEEEFTLTHAVSGYGTVTSASNVTVVIYNDELPKITITADRAKATGKVDCGALHAQARGRHGGGAHGEDAPRRASRATTGAFRARPTRTTGKPRPTSSSPPAATR